MGNHPIFFALKSSASNTPGIGVVLHVSRTHGATNITRYRPRTEGLFAQIEHHATPETDHWEVRSKDGLVSVYGTPLSLPDDPATIANPASRAEVFSWKLSKTVDPFGSTIQYEYERDAGDTPDHHWDQLYLRRIQYADYTELGADGNPVEKFLVSVTFVYEERPDPFSDHRAGAGANPMCSIGWTTTWAQ